MRRALPDGCRGLGDDGSRLGAADIELLFLLAKEGWVRSFLDVIRRELRRVSPDVRIEKEQIRAVLTQEVVTREVVEAGKADEARRKIARAATRALRTITTKPEPLVQPPSESQTLTA